MRLCWRSAPFCARRQMATSNRFLYDLMGGLSPGATFSNEPSGALDLTSISRGLATPPELSTPFLSTFDLLWAFYRVQVVGEHFAFFSGKKMKNGSGRPNSGYPHRRWKWFVTLRRMLLRLFKL